MSSRHLGAIVQIAYVVDDIHAAIAQWSGRLSVGPFFVYEHVKYRELTFRGKPTAADVSLAFAFSGDLQIELIQQHNDAPSVYREFIACHGMGLQHVGALTTDIVADKALLVSRGIEPVQHGISATGTETIYFDSGMGPGTMIELIQSSDALVTLFHKMKLAAQNWDMANAYA